MYLSASSALSAYCRLNLLLKEENLAANLFPRDEDNDTNRNREISWKFIIFKS